MAAESIYSTVLTAQQIRLLKILPSGPDPQSSVTCELHQYEVHNVPAYETLSYCWGDSNECSKVLCNGQTLSVTTNLHDALKRLRFENEPRLIWADALCIDQSNYEEKNCQVPLMGRVYSHAERVVVWLGDAENELSATQVKITLEKLGERTQGLPRLDDESSVFSFEWEEELSVVDLPSLTWESASWPAVDEVFNRPWFRRMWCVQEIRLAREAVLYWGDQVLSWDLMGQLSQWLAVGWYNGLSVPDYRIWQWALYMTDFYMLAKDGLKSILVLYREFTATDPRDKVYGVMSLPGLADETHLIEVDYTKPVARVYVEVATLLIEASRDLSPLADVVHPKDYDGDTQFVSWAPRWDLPEAADRVLDSNGDLPHRSSPWMYDDYICFSGMQLLLSGLLFDTVSSVDVEMGIGTARYEEVNMHTIWKEHGRTIFDFWLENVSHEPPQGRTCHDNALSFARTLTAGRVSNVESYHELEVAGRELYTQRFMDFISLLFHVFSHGDQAFAAPEGNGKKLFARFVVSACEGRRLFRMQNGAYGLGPSCLREDDIIVEFVGAGTPYALRPRGENYLLLGQVYIDEIMYGEPVERDVVELQEFCLI